jgi:hypothetical protein
MKRIVLRTLANRKFMKTIPTAFSLATILLASLADLQAGRWLSPDPIEQLERDPRPSIPGAEPSFFAPYATVAFDLPPREGFGSSPRFGNPYLFVSNNPINRADPLGLLDYYYSSGGLLQPSGPFLYLEAETWYGQIGAAIYNTLPVAANAINKLAPSDVGTAEGAASGNGDYVGLIVAAGIDAASLVPGEKAETQACSAVGKIAKGESRIWKSLKAAKGKTKTNGLSGKGKRYFEWDHTHGDIEVYDARGKHLGSMDPTTGNMTKPAVPGRRIDVK